MSELTPEDARRILEGLEDIHQVVRQMRDDLRQDAQRASNGLQEAK